MNINEYLDNNVYEIDANLYNTENNTSLTQEQLNELVVHTLVERLDETQTLDNDVCIITYKNRKPSVLDDLSCFADTQINVFIYDFEKELYEWLKGDNINKVYVPASYDNVNKKRLFVQEYMKDKKFWLLDDDLKSGIIAGKQRETSTTRVKIEISLAKLCKIVELMTQNRRFGIAGYKYAEIAVAFCNYKKLINDNVVDQCVLFDGGELEKCGIKYSGDKNINETLDVEIQIVRNNLDMLCLTFGSVTEFHRGGSKGTTVSTPVSHIRMKLGNYIKWGEMISLHPSKNLIIDSRLNYKKIKDPLKWDPVLLKLCEEGIVDGNADKVLEYLENESLQKTKKLLDEADKNTKSLF